MAKDNKRRKKSVVDDDGSINPEHEVGDVVISSTDPSRKKVKKQKLDVDVDATPPSKKSSKHNEQIDSPPTDPKTTTRPSSTVQFSSLQSIFATKDDQEPLFTLFAPDPPILDNEPLIPSPSAASIPRHPKSTTTAAATRPVPHPDNVKLFFAHYDDAELNAQSQFAPPEEPFFYERTMYPPSPLVCLVADGDREEKRQVWMEERYEFTQDWKKKRRAAMKIKRRREIRRTV